MVYWVWAEYAMVPISYDATQRTWNLEGFFKYSTYSLISTFASFIPAISLNLIFGAEEIAWSPRVYEALNYIWMTWATVKFEKLYENKSNIRCWVMISIYLDYAKKMYRSLKSY